MATAAALGSNEMSVQSRSFTLSNPPLTAVERVALEALKQIASEGRVAYREELQEAIGSMNECGSTATGVVNRLVAKGHAEHVAGHPLQRALWLRIVSTKQVTAEPGCKTVHWRFLTDRAPAPAIHHIRQRDMSLATWIETEARLTNRDHLGFLEELVRRGAQDYRAEKELAS